MTEGYPALETYVAVLSTGPVGPSDQIGTANKTLIMAAWSVKCLKCLHINYNRTMGKKLSLWDKISEAYMCP